MMMGSVGEVPKAPAQYAEEVGRTQQEEADHIILPAGLTNLGNSCYMNATLQAFKVRKSSLWLVPLMELVVDDYRFL